MAGYSATPLAKKLGIGPGAEVCVVGQPEGYRSLLEPLPEGVRFVADVGRSTTVVHVFAAWREELERSLPALRQKIDPRAAVWVSWPKKSAKRPGDVTEDVVREVALPMGFVDVKVAAVDEVWSGLKLVIRKELR
jgi:hypothetical protein